MTPHQTPPSVPTDEMVERAAIRLCVLDLGNEGFWKTIGEEDRNTYRDEARDVLTAALSSTQARADKLEAELVEAKREIERLRENHRVAVHRKRVTGEYRDDFKARAEAAEARAAAMREALGWLIGGIETEIDTDRLTAKFKRRIKEARALQEG